MMVRGRNALTKSLLALTGVLEKLECPIFATTPSQHTNHYSNHKHLQLPKVALLCQDLIMIHSDNGRRDHVTVDTEDLCQLQTCGCQQEMNTHALHKSRDIIPRGSIVNFMSIGASEFRNDAELCTLETNTNLLHSCKENSQCAL